MMMKRKNMAGLMGMMAAAMMGGVSAVERAGRMVLGGVRRAGRDRRMIEVVLQRDEKSGTSEEVGKLGPKAGKRLVVRSANAVTVVAKPQRLVRASDGTLYAVFPDGSFRRVSNRFGDLNKRKRRHARTLRREESAMVRARVLGL